MDKIFEMLGIEKLDEDKQAKLKDELETIILAKAQDKVDELVKVEKEKIVEEMETKFESYKEEITSKFSNFVDDILDEELVIPQNVLEYAKLGEEYKPLIESFKVKLAIDEDVLDKEVKNILKEAKDEIIKLTTEKDELVSEKLNLELENEKIVNENYLLTKCDGLTPKQKTKIMSILEGASKEEIDKKFDVLVKLNETTENFKTKECPECGAEVDEKLDTCPECEYSFVEKKSDDEKDKEFKAVDENNPKAIWLKMINERKF